MKKKNCLKKCDNKNRFKKKFAMNHYKKLQ